MRNGDSSANGNLVPNVSSSTAVVQMLGVNQGMQELRNRFLDEWIHFINGEISKKNYYLHAVSSSGASHVDKKKVIKIEDEDEEEEEEEEEKEGRRS